MVDVFPLPEDVDVLSNSAFNTDDNTKSVAAACAAMPTKIGAVNATHIAWNNNQVHHWGGTSIVASAGCCVTNSNCTNKKQSAGGRQDRRGWWIILILSKLRLSYFLYKQYLMIP